MWMPREMKPFSRSAGTELIHLESWTESDPRGKVLADSSRQRRIRRPERRSRHCYGWRAYPDSSLLVRRPDQGDVWS